MEHEKVVEASKAYVRIILRRPHAYEFKTKYEQAPIPGVIVLDAEGAWVGGFDFKGTKPVEDLLNLLGE
jgi:hypothetical protein